MGEGFTGCGTAGERYAQFTGQAGSEGLHKQGLKQAGVFFIGNVEQVYLFAGAVNAATAERPRAPIDLQHSQAVIRQVVGQVVSAALPGLQYSLLGGKGPAVGT